MRLAELDILEVWRALGGGPLRGNHGQGFWRNGDGWSISLNPKRGTWYDHRDNRGGGALSLVETALACDRRTALRWLEGNCGLDSAQGLSPAAHRVNHYERSEADSFGIAAQVLAEDLLEEMDSCDPARAAYTRLLSAIRKGGAELVTEYRAWLARDPELTRALVSAGAASDARIQRRLAFFVLELANVA